MEMSAHVLLYEEAGWVEALMKTIKLLDDWLEEADTDSELRHCLVHYACSRGGEMMEDICRGIPRFHRMAQSQDKIGWRRFMEGMISTHLVELQYHAHTVAGSCRSIKAWATGLVIKLLEITHGQ